MATESTVHPAAQTFEPHNQPYPPSWSDRLMGRIERLPGPPWLFYLVVLGLVVVVNNALHWLDGTLPLGVFHPTRTADALFPIYFPALMHYLNQVAGNALDTFRPLLHVGDAELARLRYELTTMPARVGRVTALAGLAVGVLIVASDPSGLGLEPSSSIVVILFEVALAVISAAFLLAFIYHTVHQLRLVNRIHQLVTRVNLLQLAPTYAFSTLTVRTGIGLVFFSYYMVIQQDPTQTVSNTINIGGDISIGGGIGGVVGGGLIIVMLMLSAASFVLPLNGMHRLLVEEKGRLIAEANRRLEAALARLYDDVDTQNLANMDALNKAITSLISARDVLGRISTWPWETSTTRAFATAIFLPIGFWLITRILERVLSF